MNSHKSLWGDLSKPDIVRTPFTILKEQAAILSEATNGLLIGDVERFQNQQGQRILELRVMAPSLDNYRYSILAVTHDVKLYPLSLRNLARSSNRNTQCNSEESFEQALGEILSSPEVRKVISTLLSEINAGTDKPPF